MSNGNTFDETESNTDQATDGEQQFVSFLVNQERFTFPMLSVGEIIRVPTMVSVPLGPPQMIGLANLRGNVLPVYDLSAILLGTHAEASDVTRVIVVESELGSIGFLVDRVLRVYSATNDVVIEKASMTESIAYEYMLGIIKQSDHPVEQILDVSSLARAQAVTKQDGNAMQLSGMRRIDSDEVGDANENDSLQQLVCFSLEDQEFAFHLQDVEEIVRVPADISQLPDSAPAVLGLVNLRGRIIPIVDLSNAIGMMSTEINEASRIVVTQNSEFGSIGFVVAKVSNVVSISESELESVPSVCNDGAESGLLEAVYRSDGGKRLVSIINLSNVYGRALMSVLSSIEDDIKQESQMSEGNDVVIDEDDCEQYVIFWINGQEYGVSIDDTQEITRVPDKLESVPSTPDYLKGIVNLRGTVLPVIDLRSRLGMPSSETSERQRIVVLTKDKQRTGFIVDGVAEVKTVVRQTIENAPSLSDMQSEFLNRLIKLNDEKRIIQIIEPNVLLNDNAVATAQEQC
tara:strand:- start:7749 stop:9296 length:1548 start_codon:yes stop_codon:yes gene_type:complete